MVSYGWGCRVLAVANVLLTSYPLLLTRRTPFIWQIVTYLFQITSITDIARSIYLEGVSEKHIKVAHVEFFLESIKIPNSLKSLVFLQNYGKGSTLSRFSEDFLKKFKSNYSNNIWGTFRWKFHRVAKKASSILDSSLSKAVKFSHTVMFILHYFHLRRYRILT